MRILFIVWNEDNTTSTYRQSYRRSKNFASNFDPVVEFEVIKEKLGLSQGGILLYAIDCGNGSGVMPFERLAYSIAQHREHAVPMSRCSRIADGSLVRS